MRVVHRSLLAASIVLLAGCGGGQDSVAALCDLVFSCGCAQSPYADAEACVRDVNADLDEQAMAHQAVADANGLVHDPLCRERGLAIYRDEIKCTLVSELDIESLTCSYCSPIHGNKSEGEPCTEYSLDGSDCAGHLQCRGTCVDPCQPPAAGDPCGDFGFCGPGLYCAEETTTCAPTLGPGSPCTEFASCGDDRYCAADMTCQAFPGEGQPCNGICASAFNCEAGVCVPGPGEGQPCPDLGNCGPGTECHFDSETCVAEAPLVCFVTDAVDP